MKKTLCVLAGLMAIAIVLLVLNLRESDQYEFGSETPPPKGNNVAPDDFGFERIFPEPRFTHVCSGCGECVHPYEIVENRRVLTLHDHDGWYKVFWAADEDYYYPDPVQLLADWGRNRTAETPKGTWAIRLRAAPATHRAGQPHDCGQIPREITLFYELVFSDDPLETTYHSGDGPLRIPQTFSWLVTNPGRPMSLGWRLVGNPAVDAGPCPCAK